jgi:hypothetical protein
MAILKRGPKNNMILHQLRIVGFVDSILVLNINFGCRGYTLNLVSLSKATCSLIMTRISIEQ